MSLPKKISSEDRKQAWLQLEKVLLELSAVSSKGLTNEEYRLTLAGYQMLADVADQIKTEVE